MLDKWRAPHALRYLQEVLGEAVVRVKSGESPADLPYLLQDTYEVVPCELLGRGVALACVKGPHALPAGQMGRHLRTMQERLGTRVIVALPQVSAGERKKLIEHGVAFVVPGRQLYAPWLGVILSEQFPMETRRQQEQMSPATQALLLWYLLQHPLGDPWKVSDVTVALGYTAMTASRAVRELLQLGFFELQLRGRARLLKLTMTPRQLWEKALPHLATPVQRTLWTYDARMLQLPDVRPAGESALAQHSLLNASVQPVVAVTSEAVARAKASGVQFEPRPMGGAIEVQVWRYRPTMDDKSQTADRFSVWLSLKDKQDPRIQMALDELAGTFPW